MRGLKDRTVLVTGGANGIGAAIARRLGEEGCTAGILDLDADAGGKVVAEIKAAGGKASLHAADISDYAAVSRAIEDFEQAAGPIALLVNNAGWDRAASFLDTTPEFWAKVVGINLYGPLNVSHIVLKGMAARGFGRVVNIASDAGRVGSSNEAIYSGAKGGLIAFTKTLAREMARDGITVNCVCPGWTNTSMIDWDAIAKRQGVTLDEAQSVALASNVQHRILEPEEITGMISLLVGVDGGGITGQVIGVDGGYGI